MFGGYELLWKTTAIVIIWIGVFKAMDSSVTSSIVNTIRTGAEGAGKFALKSLRYAPIFPVKVDSDNNPDTPDEVQKISLAGIGEIQNLLNAKMQERVHKDRDVITKIAPFLESQTGKNIDAVEGAKTHPEAIDAIHKMISAHGNPPLSSDQMKAIIKQSEHGNLGLTPEQRKDLKEA